MDKILQNKILITFYHKRKLKTPFPLIDMSIIQVKIEGEEIYIICILANKQH